MTAEAVGRRTCEAGAAEWRRQDAVAAEGSRGLNQSLINGLKMLLIRCLF